MQPDLSSKDRAIAYALHVDRGEMLSMHRFADLLDFAVPDWSLWKAYCCGYPTLITMKHLEWMDYSTSSTMPDMLKMWWLLKYLEYKGVDHRLYSREEYLIQLATLPDNAQRMYPSLAPSLQYCILMPGDSLKQLLLHYGKVDLLGFLEELDTLLGWYTEYRKHRAATIPSTKIAIYQTNWPRWTLCIRLSRQAPEQAPEQVYFSEMVLLREMPSSFRKITDIGLVMGRHGYKCHLNIDDVLFLEVADDLHHHATRVAQLLQP